MKKLVALICAVILLFSFASCKKIELYDWPDGEIAAAVPVPKDKFGKVMVSSKQKMQVVIYAKYERFEEYIEQCQEAGFNVDSQWEGAEPNRKFSAFNSEGYEFICVYDSANDAYIVIVYAPKASKKLHWDDMTFANIIPKPESEYGSIKKISETDYIVYVGQTTKIDFDEYLEKCKMAGFAEVARDDKNNVLFQNSDEINLHIKYSGFTTMIIEIY